MENFGQGTRGGGAVAVSTYFDTSDYDAGGVELVPGMGDWRLGNGEGLGIGDWRFCYIVLE